MASRKLVSEVVFVYVAGSSQPSAATLRQSTGNQCLALHSLFQ